MSTPSKLVLNVKSFYDNIEFQTSFISFAKTEFSSENPEFLLEINKLEKLHQQKLEKGKKQAQTTVLDGKIKEISEAVYEKFIKEGAEKQINIPAACRIQIDKEKKRALL